MTLAALQAALAALACEADARDDLARDPAGFARARGLDAREAALLRSVPLADLDAFRALVARDRAHDLRRLFPLAVALAGDALAVRAYARAAPYPLDRWPDEGRRFAAYLAQAAPRDLAGRAAVDLARYEAAALALRAEDARGAFPPVRTPTAAPVILLAAGHRFLRVATNVPELVDALRGGEPALPRAWPRGVLLRREAGGGVTSVACSLAESIALAAAAERPRPREAVVARAAREGALPRERVEGALDELLALGVLEVADGARGGVRS